MLHTCGSMHPLCGGVKAAPRCSRQLPASCCEKCMISLCGAHVALLSLQCGELEAVLRQQQEARASLEGQLAGSRQRVKELQVWR